MQTDLPNEPDLSFHDEVEVEGYPDLYEQDYLIDGDCNESQPCRGDEEWLTDDLD